MLSEAEQLSCVRDVGSETALLPLFYGFKAYLYR